MIDINNFKQNTVLKCTITLPYIEFITEFRRVVEECTSVTKEELYTLSEALTLINSIVHETDGTVIHITSNKISIESYQIVGDVYKTYTKGDMYQDDMIFRFPNVLLVPNNTNWAVTINNNPSTIDDTMQQSEMMTLSNRGSS